MARPGTSGPTVRSLEKRRRIEEAAMATLVELGYSRASTRAIAERGGFNQALIHYYFGSLNALWLAVVDATSTVRMERYRTGVLQAGTLEEVIEEAITIYREDLESGQMTLISELVGAGLSEPDLGQGLLERMEPWVDFVGEVLERVLNGSPLASLIPTREAASALISFYLGVNLLTRLDPSRRVTDSLFETARSLAPALSPMFGSFSVGGEQK